MSDNNQQAKKDDLLKKTDGKEKLGNSDERNDLVYKGGKDPHPGEDEIKAVKEEKTDGEK